MGPNHEAVLGEAEVEQRAVTRLVRAGRQVGDHVGLSIRRVGQDRDELFFRLAGEPHDDVEGSHRRWSASLLEVLFRDLPLVLAGVEGVRLLHVVRRKLLGLDIEKVARIADVRLQPGRHLAEGFEEAGEDGPVGVGDGVLAVDLVEGRGSAVGIDHHLDGVADIVDIRQRTAIVGRRRPAVRVMVCGRESVEDPVELPVDDHDVGILVEPQEGRQNRDPVLDRLVEEDLGLRGQLRADQDVDVAEADRERQLAQRRR